MNAPHTIDAFETTLQKTNELLKTIEDLQNWEGRRHQAYTALRVTLHALRDRLPLEHAVHFGAQLPMLVRGFYYEGWNPHKVPRKMKRDEFLHEIQSHFVFQMENGIEEMVSNIINAVLDRMSPEEAKKIQNALPKDVAELISNV
jgi:uncharacterized protein (DUF2267 family)